MIRQLVVSVVLVAVLLAAGVGAFVGLVHLRVEPPSMDPERRPLVVDALRLEPVTAALPLEGFGTARADQTAVISAQVSGLVVKLGPGLRDGASVNAGDLLVQIDARDYRAQLARARSSLAADQAALAQLDVEQRNVQALIDTASEELGLAEREYRRIMDLFEGGTSNPRELDAARLVVQRARRTLQSLENDLALLPGRREQLQATCESRRAEVALAELNLERCTIVAPFDGRAEHVQIEVGEQATPGQPLLSVLDPALIEVPIELPVSQRERGRVGATVTLTLESRRELTWSGHVARIAPSADEATRTFALFVEVRNPTVADDSSAATALLMPGMFVRAHVEGPLLHDALLVPRGCVRRGQVFVCVDGQAWRRDVQIEHRLLERVALRGLAPGQIVLTSNLDALVDGTPVQPNLLATADRTDDQKPAPPTSAPTMAADAQQSRPALPTPTPLAPSESHGSAR